MLKTIRILLLLGLVAASITIEAQAATNTIDVIHAKGIINPVLADYISRSIEQAEESNAPVAIIQLDTPGGLDTSMRHIIKAIDTARIPICDDSSPSGARSPATGE